MIRVAQAIFDLVKTNSLQINAKGAAQVMDDLGTGLATDRTNQSYIMISQFEVGGLLRREIPSLASHYCPSKPSLEVYAFMNYFSDYTKAAIEQQELGTARRCFALADRLFRNGDRMVRSLIENVFVFSFSSMLNCEQEERTHIRTLIPVTLYALYMKQVNRAGV
jgi:hypothetical protein